MSPQTNVKPAAMTDAIVDLVVLYRGMVKMVPTVPYEERTLRKRHMKMYAKTLQNADHSRFVLMRIDRKFIKLYSLNEPEKLLLEISCDQLDLVKQSRKDVCFFYFTTYSTNNTTSTMAPSNGPIPNLSALVPLSGYTCYVFHGNCTKTADKAYEWIKNFVDFRIKTQDYYQLNDFVDGGKLNENSQLLLSLTPTSTKHAIEATELNEQQNVTSREALCTTITTNADANAKDFRLIDLFC